jgi:HNH endonuclease
MTVKRAESITGLDIRQIQNPASLSRLVIFGAFSDGTEVARQADYGVSRTLTLLVETLYKREQKKAYERARYRCERCARIKPLETHHKVFRSHGRRDTADNLEVLCVDCHGEEHGG